MAKITVFFLLYTYEKYLFLLFSIQTMREITLTKHFCIIITRYIHFLPVAPWQYHVWRCIQCLGLMKKNHIFSKFENMCIKL